MIHNELNTRLNRILKMAFVDFKGRYYNKKLGLLWAFLIPAIQIALYYFIFHYIFQTEQENYVLFLFSGLMIWLSFIQSGNLGIELLIKKKHLLETVQFNWLDLFISSQIAVFYSLLIQLVAYIILLIFTGVQPGSFWYLLPVMLTLWFVFSLAISILLGLLYPIFEDIYHIWNLIGMIGLWSSGVFFSGTLFFKDFEWFAYVNPMVGLLMNTRACLLEGQPIYWNLFWVNLLTFTCLIMIAIILFRKKAKKILEHA